LKKYFIIDNRKEVKMNRQRQMKLQEKILDRLKEIEENKTDIIQGRDNKEYIEKPLYLSEKWFLLNILDELNIFND